MFIFFLIIFIVDMLVVGFVIKNIKIVLGDSFVVRNLIVSGVDVVVYMYIGMLISVIISMVIMLLFYCVKKLVGIYVLIVVVSVNLINNYIIMFLSNLLLVYESMFVIFEGEDLCLGLFVFLWLWVCVFLFV